MIADRQEVLAEDLSYLKKLASEGRGRPAPMAMLVAGFGLLYGTGCLLDWWLITGFVSHDRPRSDMDFLPVAWPVIHSLFLLLLAGCLLQAFLQRGKAMPVNRVAAAGWTAAFIGFVTIAACTILQGQTANNYFAMNLLPSFLLVLWGFGWFVSAAATGRNWLYAVALGSFCAAPLWAMTATFSLNGFLVSGLCFLLLAFVPGIILMRRG